MSRRKPVQVPYVVLKFMIDTLERTSVEIPCLVDGISPCWVRRTLNLVTYGSVSVGPWRLPAHWASFQMQFGYVDDPDLILDHLCRTPACWNAWHLDLVTQKVNMERVGAHDAIQRLRREHADRVKTLFAGVEART